MNVVVGILFPAAFFHPNYEELINHIIREKICLKVNVIMFPCFVYNSTQCDGSETNFAWLLLT